jgi:hypothetical protein
MEPKPLGFHRTEGANDKIEKRNALIFARHPIGIAYNRLSTMLTDVIHIVSRSAMNMPYWIDLIVRQMRTFNGFQRDFLSNSEREQFFDWFYG